MRWDQLGGVLKENKGAYIQWLAANLGGLIVAYMASGTIWVFHATFGNYLPGPEAFLMTGVITLAVAGVSYVCLPYRNEVPLSPVISYSWAFPLAAVYGVLIAMGVKTPVLSANLIWLITIIVAMSCWLWSTVIWLHEQGIRKGWTHEPVPPEEPPQAFRDLAARLPKLTDDQGAPHA